MQCNLTTMLVKATPAPVSSKRPRDEAPKSRSHWSSCRRRTSSRSLRCLTANISAKHAASFCSPKADSRQRQLMAGMSHRSKPATWTNALVSVRSIIVGTTKDVYQRPARRSLDSVQQAPDHPEAVIHTEASRQGASLVVGQRSPGSSKNVLKPLKHFETRPRRQEAFQARQILPLLAAYPKRITDGRATSVWTPGSGRPRPTACGQSETFGL